MPQSQNLAFDLILKNGHVATPWGVTKTDIAVKNGRIEGIGDFSRGIIGTSRQFSINAIKGLYAGTAENSVTSDPAPPR